MTIISKYNGVCKRCGGVTKIGDSVDWTPGYGATHVSALECEASARPEPNAVADLGAVIAFLVAAKERGLKRPVLRVLDTDGQSELRLSLSGVRSRTPGSVVVKRNDSYLGVVRPSGESYGRFTPELLARLLAVAESHAEAAKSYAALMGRCSFCGLQLTDAGSVEVGYGPVCARRWGLPHTPQGTPALVQATAPPMHGGSSARQAVDAVRAAMRVRGDRFIAEASDVTFLN